MARLAFALLVALAPCAASAQVFETDFNDLTGWTANWPDDAWRARRGQAGPTTDAVCGDVDPNCRFGGAPEAVDNLLTAGDPNWADYRVTARFTNFDNDASGFVFRHRDANNYYLFLQSLGTWPSATVPSHDESGVTSRLYRVQNGRVALLASANSAYTQVRAHLIRIDAVRDRITVYFDANGDGLLPASERLFLVEDPSPILSGRVGLWAYANRNFFVDWLRVFRVVPPPEPQRFRVTSMDRAGRTVRFGFELATAATGYLMTAEGRCADVDPATRQADAGVGTRIFGALNTLPDHDYCVRACATTVNGTACGGEIDLSTRGAVIDTSSLSPGHWDLLDGDQREHLRTRPAGARLATTARFGRYVLKINGRDLPFSVDERGGVRLTGGDLGGAAQVVSGSLVISGHVVDIDMARQRVDARWAVFGAQMEVGLGAYQGRDRRRFKLLAGDYVVRTRGEDVPFTVGADGAVSVPAGAHAALVGGVLFPNTSLTGEAVAFRVTIHNQGPNALRAGGVFNGRTVRPDDDAFMVLPGLRDYAVSDAIRARWGNLAASLGFLPGVHAWYAFNGLAPGAAKHVDVLVFPSNPRLEFLSDVTGTRDSVVATAAPFTGALFDAAGEPASGSLDLAEYDTDQGSQGALRRRFTAPTGRAYGTLSWEVLARSSTPSAPEVHSMTAAGDKVRVSFTATRDAQGSVQYVLGPCAGANWAQAREASLGNGVAYAGDLITVAGRDYCARARTRNAAGSRVSAGVSFTTTEVAVDATDLRGRYRLQVPGPNQVSVVQAGDVRRDLGVRMGRYLIDQGGAPLEILVNKDGEIAYDAALEGVLLGAGTDRLTLAGVPVQVDLRSVTGDANLAAGVGNASDLALGGLSGGVRTTLRLLPGQFGLTHGERHAFRVEPNGAVAPAAEGAFTGGPNVLTALGRAVHLDLLPVPGQVGLAAARGVPAHGILEGGGVRDVGLLPGRYTLLFGGARALVVVDTAAAPSFARVPAELPLLSCGQGGAAMRAEGQGTDTLVVRAEPCAVTATIACETDCGDGPEVFQLRDGRGTASATVRYASGQAVRADEVFAVDFSVDGGGLGAAQADTQDGTAAVPYAAADRRGDYLLRVTVGGMSSTRAFVVIPIRDFAPPDIRPAADMVVEQTNAQGTRVRLEAPNVRDNVDPAPRVTSDAPATFPLGRSVVTWRAVDFNGNASFANQTVTVVDTTAPILRAPARIEVEATSAAGTPVPLVDVQAEDICDAQVDITRDGPRRFVVGETPVTWTATDDSGNQTTAQTVVAVVDTTPPVLHFQREQIVVEMTNNNGARGANIPLPVVTDNGDPDPQVEHNAPGVLPRGRTMVTFVATDASGNQASARIAINVVDSTAPTLTVEGAPTGWVERAEFLVNAHDRGDEAPVLGFDPAPDAESAGLDGLTVAYATGGVYDVAISAVDDRGNRTQRLLRTFGVDADAPRLRIHSALRRRVNPDDQASWPVVFGRQRVDLRVDATDAPAAGVSGIARIRMVLDPDTADPIVLADEAWPAQGAPLPAGPASVRGVVCTDEVVCTADGRLLPARAGGGAHTILIDVVDHAGRHSAERLYYRSFTLAGALEEARAAVLAARGGDGVANEALVALEQAAGFLGEAADLAVGQPAGVDAPVDLTGHVLRKLQRVAPAMRRAARFGVDVGPIDQLYGGAIYWAVAGFGQVGLAADVRIQADYEQARDVFLADALEQLRGGNVQQSLASLIDAYFLFDNALRPLFATTFGEALSSVTVVRDQLEAYLEVEGRPGAAALVDLVGVLNTVIGAVVDYDAAVGDAATIDDILRALELVPAEDYRDTLLLLQEGARALLVAGQDEVYTRSWAWALVQSVMFLSDMGFQRSAFVMRNGMVPEANTLVPAGTQLVADGQALVDGRRIDRFFALFLERGTECLILEMYKFGFERDYALPGYCEE